MKRIDDIDKLDDVVNEVCKVIHGRKDLIEMIIMALLADGHVLLEGVPGTAKTLTISALCKVLGGKFRRIQMIPDMLPSDITGTYIYSDGKFEIEHGPLVNTNFVLADEINRCPARTQAALLESMQERQVTILGKKTFDLLDPFMVLATQNPIEQEGTYRLPEAQIDRFLLKLIVPYTNMESEKSMLKNIALDQRDKIKSLETICQIDEILRIRENIKKTIKFSDSIIDYIVRIVNATRTFNKLIGYKNNIEIIKLGASPRAIFALRDMARVRAYMVNREYIYPEDVHKVMDNVLRHRIDIDFRAKAKNWTSELVLQMIKERVKPTQ